MINKYRFRNFLLTGLVGLGMMVSSQASAKNPFKALLPQKPVQNVAAESVSERKDRQRALQSVELPKVEVKIEPPALILSGLVWNSSRPQAIVNGTIVRVGDEINGVTIIKIARDGVEGDFKDVKVYLKP